jgi:hypothetical protein
MLEIIPPSFVLQRKVGGSAARLITPDAVSKAQSNVDSLRPPIQKEVARLLEEIARAARVRDKSARDIIWSRAHEIRGLAGSAKRAKLGQISNILCQYLNDSDGDFKPDPNLITTITVAALHTLREGSDDDKLVEILVNDCARAAQRQKVRENRGDLSQ